MNNCCLLILTAYGPSYGAVPTSQASMAATSAGYPDYSQMTAASQGGMPAAAPGAQPRLETPAATDYSAYGKTENVCIYCSFHSFVKISFTSVAQACLAVAMAMRLKTNLGDD